MYFNYNVKQNYLTYYFVCTKSNKIVHIYNID